MSNPIPVILDTDIGGDIDDTWALAMLLNSPELELKLVTSATGDTRYRAKIIAKLLEVARRTDVPVGIGVQRPMDTARKTQAAWVEDYDLGAYPGAVHRDGVEALIATIMHSPTPVTLICIGPLTNIQSALEREPAIAARTRFVGMHGSIRRQHHGKPGPIAEFNVIEDVAAAQAVFTAPWREIVITPLDTCGRIQLEGAKYQAVRNCPQPLLAAVVENYRIWRRGGAEFERQSSILFDTVAVHLACSEEFLKMENMKILVDAAGFTRESAQGKPMRVASDWLDLPAYEDFLVARLQDRR